MTRAGGQELATALHHNSSLLHIGLSSNRIGEEGAKNLASVLMLNHALETLYLEGPPPCCPLAALLSHLLSLPPRAPRLHYRLLTLCPAAY